MSALFNETITSGWDAIYYPRAPSYVLPTAAAVVASVALYSAVFASSPKDTDIHELGGLSIITAWQFFFRRSDFFKSNFSKTGLNLFSFKFLHHSVVAVKGEAARKAFFNERSLDFLQGYQILVGGVPSLEDVDAPIQHLKDIPWLNKQLLALLHKDRMTKVLPTLFEDIQKRMEGWGKEGRMDPFQDIYNLVFQLTVRMATCRELATNLSAVDKLQKDYWMLETSATPTALLLSWLPCTGKKSTEMVIKSLFTTIHNYVETRQMADVVTLDAIDILLARGLTTEDTTGVILAIIFTGVLNTGINVCWLLLYLSFNKHWKQKVTEEVNTIIETYTNAPSSDPLHERLSAIPVSAWEDAMPTLDLVIRETIRLTINGAFLRRNINDDLHIVNKRLPKGHFVAYTAADAHLNPDIYDNPTEFDPARFLPGREEHKRQTHAYLGWGAGRHPCTGVKMAKLEVKIIVAFFLAGYEYDVVDSKGGHTETLPRPDYNDVLRTRPLGDPCYIQFKRVVD